MTQENEQALAASLWQARLQGQQLQASWYPDSMASAYRVQQQMDRLSGETLAGYKIGATATETMAMLGVDAPFTGPLYPRFYRQHGATVPVHEIHNPRIEPEFAVCLGQSLVRQPGAAALSLDEIADAVAWVAPAIEFIGIRFHDTPAGRGVCAVADAGSNLDFVIGEPRHDWRSLDLTTSPVALNINGEQVAEGHSGLSITGNPLLMLGWLINESNLAGAPLDAGMVVSCGTCTPPFPVSAGDSVRADYRDLGSLECQVSAATGAS